MLAERPIEGVSLGFMRVVKVETGDATKGVNDMLEEIKEKQRLKPDVKQIVLHFGVAHPRKLITFEIKGYNKENFSRKPAELPIFQDVACGHALECIMPYGDIINKLKGLKLAIELSTDPGYYLCNYIYYVSLYKTLPLRIPSVFIHIPLFSTMSKEDQFHVIHELFKEIKDTYCSLN
eukprot:TRINITY_DN11222_c0_g1_i4.p1 TRINITY_DN11222_c0_g1~~TRINITY_DN11222_c0_g1_i4.p1  ORF type:complete len:178 (-),score=35.73 TRINITY_DN11222_c0_g1_i4:170-703(-)